MSRTAKEALIAELLGDVDALLRRVESLPGAIGEAEENTVKKQGEMLKEFERVTGRFNEVTTRSVDDFIEVANEALSKFKQRTGEIVTLLNSVSPARTVAEPSPQSESKTDAASSPLWWLVPSAFGVGVLVGALLILALK